MSTLPIITHRTSPDELAHLLNTSIKKLNYVLYAQDVENHYKSFQIEKKNGGIRTINAPNEMLKNLQRRMCKVLLPSYNPHPAAAAFIPNRGIVYNASKHVKRYAVFNIDLKDFYKQIHFGRVKGMLQAPPYNFKPETAQLIAKICCVGGAIPQGAPTSPLISNMICKSLDNKLSLLAKNCHAYYTRYADDITFSFHKKPSWKIVKLSGDKFTPSKVLENIIDKSGFSINSEKTRYQTYKERQIVTGVKVNQKLNIDRKYIRTTRAMIHALANGETELNNKYRKQNRVKASQSLLSTVLGRIHYIKMIKGHSSSVFITLAKKLNNLNLGKTINIDRSEHGRLQHSYPFYKEENRKRLESCVWILEFSDVKECSVDEQLVQGTAFMLTGQRLMTASHVFKKAGNPSYCFVRRVNEKNKKYKAFLVNDSPEADIAELQIKTDEDEGKFNYLNVSSDIVVNPGYEVAVVGFPEFMESQDFVSIKACRVINNHIFSTFEHKEVDVPIHSGNSGGPVVDGYMNVVGMAVKGVEVAYFTNQTKQKDGVEHAPNHIEKNGSIVKHKIRRYLEIPDKFVTRFDIREEVEKKLNSIETTIQLEGLNAFITSKYF